MKNGDRLSGTILKSDGKTLILKTTYAGELSVQWNEIQGITSTHELHIKLKDGKTVVGEVSTVNGNLNLSTKTAGTVEASKEHVVAVRNDAEEANYEQSLHPRLIENWEGGTTIGFALTRGNSQTTNLALAFTADRKTLHDRLGLYANSVYATNNAPGSLPGPTANAQQGGIRYDHNLKPRLFAYVSADFQADELLTLNLRSILGGGLGFEVIKTDPTTLNILFGGNYTHENYDAFSRNLAGLTLGDEFMHRVYTRTILTQTMYFYPDLSQTGEYRFTFNFGTVTKINKWLGWQNSFGDIYVSNPPLGKRRNDVLFTTGLNVSLIRSLK